ncbi:MAG: AAA family ATPase [Streptosporangiaceae bacterium]|nr:AAA family ATPase [Streptosporangiaceae bacterium]
MRRSPGTANDPRGPNGSGKSNFLDALEFLCRAVATSPNQALEERGGLEAVLRQVPDRSGSFSVSVEAAVPWWPAPSETTASYEIEIGRAQDGAGGIAVLHESCVLRGPGGTGLRLSLVCQVSSRRPPCEFLEGRSRSPAGSNVVSRLRRCEFRGRAVCLSCWTPTTTVQPSTVRSY